MKNEMNTVVDLFKETVKHSANKVAIIDDDFNISYNQLDCWSDHIAMEISRQGLAPESPVIVFLSRSAKYIAAILGVLKSGCCYIPIDLSYPKARIEYIAEMAGAYLFIGDNISCKQLGKHAKTVNLDKLTHSAKDELFTPKFIPGPTSLAYIIFTSGSTGKPKGVEVEHHSLYNLVKWHHKEFSKNEHHRTTLAASIGFDASVWESWSNITAGNTIYILNQELILNPPALAKWLEQNEIDECFLPTPLAEKLLEQKFSPKAHLKYLHAGGEQLSRYPSNDFPAALTNLYGPTECTVIASWAVFQPGECPDRAPVIGKAVDNCYIYVLDDCLKPVDTGEIGEIYIGGACLARGYRNLHDKTKEVFIENPFKKGERLYRSGDIGKCLPDGNYVFLKRKDFQAKIRGNRIELGEIEAVLEQHPEVNKSVVTVQKNSAGRKYLAAYITVNGEKHDCEAKLKKLASQYLPDYMQPLTYAVLAGFPLTSHGKIDRMALPKLEIKASTIKTIVTPVEKILMAIWGEILKTGIADTESSFYSQGGDSLLLVSLALEVEKRFKLRLPVSFFTAYSTIKSQAIQIAQRLKSNDPISQPGVIKRNHNDSNIDIKASPAQEKMWRQYTGYNGDSMFNIPMLIHLDGNISMVALTAALNEIIMRHAQLRSSFKSKQGMLCLNIHEKLDFSLAFSNLSNFDNEKQIVELDKWKEKYKALKFDFAVAPLIAGRLFKCGEHRYELLLTIHHLIFDGWSSVIFFDELASLCSDFIDGKPIPFTVDLKQPEYTDYIYWQERWLESEAAEQQLNFWRKELTGSQATPALPFARSDAEYDTRAERWYFDIDEELTAGLRKIAAACDATLFVVLQAVLQMQVYRHTGAIDLTTGTAVANRNIPGSEKIIGLFINALAIRGDLSGNPSLNNLIKQLNSKIKVIIENQEYPFGLVATAVQDVIRNKGSIFNISLLLQNIPHPAWEYPNVTLTADELGSDKAKLDIMITLEERLGRLIGWYEYKAAKFSSESIQKMQKDFCGMLAQAVNEPERKINDYDCLDINTFKTKTCFVFGETGMAISACDILREAGFHILGIISDDRQVLEWGDSNAIPSFNPHKIDIDSILRAVPFDYLFSVIYSHIIKDDILKLAKCEALNYHDSRLPGYAGMYASTWAILNQEISHAVSWHRMVSLVDGGDIFKQREINIEADDISETLNFKCTLGALESLRELLEDFKTGRNKALPQDLSKRTYFGLYDRPDNLGFIDCRENAEKLCALIKAHNYGQTENVFGSAKFVWQQAYYIVGKVELATSCKNTVVGEIVDKSTGSISVQVANGVLKLSKLTTIDGAQIDAERFCCGSKITFPDVNNPLFKTTYNKALRAEKYWIEEFRNCIIPELPLIHFDESESRTYTLDSGEISYSETALLGLFISRLICDENFTLMLNRCWEINAPGLYIGTVPCNIQFDHADTTKNVLQDLEHKINDVMKHQLPLRDITYRYNDLCCLNKLPFELELINERTVLRSAPGKNCENFIQRFKLFCSMLKNLMDVPVKQLPLITENELITQINDFNLSKRDYDLNSNWLETFKKRLPTYANNTALVYGQDSISYKELDYLSDLVAKKILTAVKPSNSPVAAVLAKPSKALIPVLIGIFKAGFTYLPVELKRYPKARIQHIFADADCEIVINLDEKAVDFIANIDNCQVLDFSEGIKEAEVSADFNINQKMYSNDNAYIIYTSGSSGTPKGVIISHKNLLNHNLGVIDDFELTAADRVLQFGALGFDLSIEEIFPTLLIGACLVLLPDGIMEDQRRFLKFIKFERISVLDLPTAYWHKLVNLLKTYTLPESLRLTIIGGEKAALESFDLWNRFTDGVRLINTYGPTETTIIATSSENPGTIGKPVANTCVYILDKYLKPLPLGVVGELCIGGAGVGKGYLNQPRKTAEVFIDNPFISGEKIYRNGDLAEFTSEGEINFRCRCDNQVKLRGFRIELGDIESAIKSYPSVVNTVVCVKESGKNKFLTAYVVSDNKDFNETDLKKYLEGLLPRYMLPAYIMRINNIALNLNGKTDFSKLPNPEKSNNKVKAIDELSSILEMQVSLLLERLLDCKHVDLDKTFIELGVDSLMVTEVILELEKLTNFKITTEGFWHLSVRKYLRKVESSANNTNNNSLVMLANNGEKPPLYLLHTLPGDILSYIDLVRTLSNNQVIYGIQSPYLKTAIPKNLSLEELAKQYVNLIIENNRGEEIYLCGWCFGEY